MLWYPDQSISTPWHYVLGYLLVDPNNDFRSSRTVVYCHYKYICSVQSRNLHNLEIAQCILRIRKLHANLEIAH